MSDGLDIPALLASPAFTTSRRAVRHLVDHPDRLRELIADVESKEFPGWDAHDPLQRVPMDMACAVVEGRIEEIEAGEDAPLASERVNLVVATLHYFARTDDEIPDHRLSGHLDDVMLLRWAIHQAQSELPVEG